MNLRHNTSWSCFVHRDIVMLELGLGCRDTVELQNTHTVCDGQGAQTSAHDAYSTFTY